MCFFFYPLFPRPCILECSWDRELSAWRYLRTRNDKDTPNFITVYRNTFRSIEDNITEDVILDYIEARAV